MLVSENETMAIDAVLFDYGQVLSTPPDPAVWERMRALTGWDEQQLHVSYWVHRDDYDRGALTGQTYWDAVAAHAGTTFDPAQIEALLSADVELWTRLNQPMVDWAARLQASGMRTGILSNIGDAIAEGICAKLPWLTGFDHCTWSYALRMAKPEEAIYLATAHALRTTPSKILFIDDREDNVAAAQSVGMHAIQYTGHREFEEAMRTRDYAFLLEA
jgi:putative hydrolase of the HAD superfamily